jgi:hypothetical protein
MWITVLLLAVAVNFEPTRLGMITLLLTKPRPMWQLVTFLSCWLTMSASAGLVVLFVFHTGFLQTGHDHGPKIQIVIGAAAVLIAALLASNLPLGASFSRPLVGAAIGSPDGTALPPGRPPALDRLVSRAGQVVKTESLWFPGITGVWLALPSPDYVAMLILIAASGAAPLTQVGALITWLAVANGVAAVPLASYLIAPERTRAWLSMLNDWIRARRRRDFAMLLAVVGTVMVAVGVSGL